MGLDLGSRTATKGGTHDAVIMNLTPKCPCEGRVVDRDTAVLQHQFEIAVADREHQVPAYGPQDHLGRELPALELFALRHDTCAAIRLSRRHVYPIRTRLTNLQQIPSTFVVPVVAIDGRQSA